MDSSATSTAPLFSAVSSSARQLFLLLRCINFAPKAQVQITREGLRFSAEESRVMQGLAFLDRSLFTTYNYTPPPSSNTDNDGDDEEAEEVITFQISLPSLLETLQIFGFTEATSSSRSAREGSSTYTSTIARFGGGGPNSTSAAFDNRTLNIAGLCRISYASPGSPLTIILEEAGVTTTCDLVTYAPEASGEGGEAEETIPLDRNHLATKIIMRSSWLHDAITELSSTTPHRLTISASPSSLSSTSTSASSTASKSQLPHLTLSSSGPLGSATVSFPSSSSSSLLETFHCPRPVRNTYKFSLIKAATRAMALATKVSLRCDEQGVLSLQFMVELVAAGASGGQGGGAAAGGGGGGSGVCFVDFRFVPLVPDEDEDEDEDGDDDGDPAGDHEPASLSASSSPEVVGRGGRDEGDEYESD
ncbi:MAG: hypothetical protein M1819_002355 [Sarea resinae]|nr:MAG: hypothetical protein M1819_002355 [Sarea resinae]